MFLTIVSILVVMDVALAVANENIAKAIISVSQSLL